jgi:hypothetical protein
MSFGSPSFIIAIVAMSMIAWVITTAIRAKHGYPLEDEWGGKTVHPRDAAGDPALKAENEQLRSKIETLEERLKVLERIATDPAKRLAEDIDNLR